MIEESKLILALENAHKAGDTQAAQHLAGVIKQQRTQWSQSKGFTNNNIVNKYGIDEAERKNQELAGDNDPTAGMSKLDRVRTGFGKGGMDIWQGAQQLLKRGANAKLPEHLEYDTSELDQAVRQEDAQFNKDFEGDWLAKGGRIGGQIAVTAPISMGVGALAKPIMGSSRTLNALQYAKQGATVGATESALMPTMTNDWEKEKLAQIGMGAGFGGVLGGGVGALKGGKELLDDGIGATIENTMSGGGKTGVGKLIKGSADDIAERKELYARNPDIIASKAQKSGSKYDKIIEEFGKSNVFLADKADDMATKELASLSQWVSNQADNIAKTKNTTEQTFRNIQLLPKKIVNKMRTDRTAQASKDYGKIDNYARGQKVVKLDNLNQAIDDFVASQKGVKGSDAQKMYNQAIALKKQFAQKPPSGNYQYSMSGAQPVAKEAGDMTASQAMRQLQSWSGGGTGKLFKDIEDYGVNERTKSLFKNALLNDMDNVGGDVGQHLRSANKNWMKASKDIQQVEGSIFGKIAGKELKGSIDGVLDNTIAPEKVLQDIRTAPPTRVKGLMEYMNTHDPKLKKEFQAQYINNAIDEAMISANTAGMETKFNPSTFLSSLGVTKGKKGWEGVKRLRAIFGNDKKAQVLINDMLALTRNASDAFGKNFSGTASHNFLNDMFSSMNGFFTGSADLIKKGTSTLAHYLGSKNILDDAYKTAQPFKKTVNKNASNLAGQLSALGTPTVMNEANN